MILGGSRTQASQSWALEQLGATHYIDYTRDVSGVPAGRRKVIYIHGPLPGPSEQEVRTLATQAPGSVWYILGEPNRHAWPVADLVQHLHPLYAWIRDADPTALITSPSVLNWEFTCLGCGGYTSGRDWFDEFRSEYLAQHGIEPPVDIWAIDVFPIDWLNPPPMVNFNIVRDQLLGYRAHLSSLPAHAGKPIWVTEFGTHWGWDSWKTSSTPGCFRDPAGTHQAEAVHNYLRTAFNWLEANAAALNIQKWFLFSSYADIHECNAATYAGLSLLDGPGGGVDLTSTGQFYRDWVHGIR